MAGEAFTASLCRLPTRCAHRERERERERDSPHLKEDDDGADEHADALEKISHHVDEGRSYAGVGLLSPPPWKKVALC